MTVSWVGDCAGFTLSDLKVASRNLLVTVLSEGGDARPVATTIIIVIIVVK